MRKFISKSDCYEYIRMHDLNAIPIPVYSEDDDIILYWIIHIVD